MTADIMGVNGLIIIVGLSAGMKHSIEINKLLWHNNSIITSCGAPYFFQHTIDFLEKKLVDFEKIITHRFPFEKAREAFDLCNISNAGKILLYPDASKMPN